MKRSLFLSQESVDIRSGSTGNPSKPPLTGTTNTKVPTIEYQCSKKATKIRLENTKSDEDSNSSNDNNTTTATKIIPWWHGLGGLSHGSFFRVDDYSFVIDSSRPPGLTKPPPPQSMNETIRTILIGNAFFYSPNVTWFLMAVCLWYLVPYDLEIGNVNGGPEFEFDFGRALLERLPMNLGIALAYIGFWHWILYGYGICERPFVSNRIYSVRKIFHNAFYTVLGIVQWTFVEGAFLYLYRSGKLPYTIATTTTIEIPAGALLRTLLLSIALVPYRDVHFYFVHRLIHVRCLYKYIHSLHHRSTDSEPFAGLAMHPVEHMYYFTCYGPLLVLPIVFPNACSVSPFLVFWMGLHLVISPAASHSGYEDHFSADVAHYLHHRYCECNYSGGINFDACFGTYRDTLKKGEDEYAYTTATTNINNYGDDSSSSVPPNNNKCDNDGTVVRHRILPPPPADPKTSLGFPPEHFDYELGTYGLVFVSLWAFYRRERTVIVGVGPGSSPCVPAVAVALFVTVGPAVWALVLSARTAPKTMSWRKICLAPFDKDATASLMLHLGLGFSLGVLPVTYLMFLILER